MAKDTVLSVVIEEITAAGLEYRIDHGGKHTKVRWWCQGQRRTYTCPVTASDHRSIKNNRACIRRLIKEAQGNN